jgi:hypothetical protein
MSMATYVFHTHMYEQTFWSAVLFHHDLFTMQFRAKKQRRGHVLLVYNAILRQKQWTWPRVVRVTTSKTSSQRDLLEASSAPKLLQRLHFGSRSHRGGRLKILAKQWPMA